MSARDLLTVPALQNHWVAISPRGHANDRETPLKLALNSGAIVVDADLELEHLVARLKAAKQTSLTIVYNGKR